MTELALNFGLVRQIRPVQGRLIGLTVELTYSALCFFVPAHGVTIAAETTSRMRRLP